MKNANSVSSPSGCAVVLEPGCCWPAHAFAAAADSERVVVMHVDPTADLPQMVERIVTHSSEFEHSGARLRTVILACAGSDGDTNGRRLALARALLPLLKSGEGRLVLTSDPALGPSTLALMGLVGNLLSELDGRSIAFLANDQSVISPARTPRKDSGVFLVDSAQLRQLDENGWPEAAKLLEAVDEAL